MVLQRLLPKEGGPFRRFLAIRQRLYRDAYYDDRPLPGPISLFDFRVKDDAADLRDSIGAKNRGLFAGWRVSDDSVIGGYSTSSMVSVSNQVPYLRWSGSISTKINKTNPRARHITRSGFAAIMTPEYPFGAPLGNRYKALEICCRTDGRTYACNLNVETYFPGDMYQAFIGRDGMVNEDEQPTIIDHEQSQDLRTEDEEPNQSLDVREYIQHRYKRMYKIDPSNDPITGFPPKGFTRLILPFTAFTLSSQGRERMEQRDLDGAVKIESIGFTLMDGKDGDFFFDLVSIRAVNVLEGEVVGTSEDEAREEEMRIKFMEEAGKSP